ncbi:MAG: hypothetical protein SOH91_03265 [Lactobacillus delbrueckii]
MLCAFCNGRFYGGGFQISPKSKINDGLLDMVILPKVNRLFAPYYIYKILRKDLISCKDVVRTDFLYLDKTEIKSRKEK